MNPQTLGVVADLCRRKWNFWLYSSCLWCI